MFAKYGILITERKLGAEVGFVGRGGISVPRKYVSVSGKVVITLY